MWVIEDSIKRVILSVSLINTCKFDREHLSFVCFKAREDKGDREGIRHTRPIP